MSSASEKFQHLLRELFQFDCADLDFGIYRVMNYKRDVIETFITDALPRTIADELRSGGGRSADAREAAVYNHLYAFFSRYYQDGDFISKRRYSKRQRYAIPYNGEEVYLHWANGDQYYVKSDEHFRDYTFTRDGVSVRFTVRDAEVEQNDVKGDKRFFLPQYGAVTWDAAAGRVLVPFEYRPLTRREEHAYGRTGQQEAINGAAVTEIPQRLRAAGAAAAAATLTAERLLEYHLRRYTRRNASDFFIHKNLRAFLAGELDFYLKNEVLDLDEMESTGEELADGWFRIMRAIKAVGGRIIDFLAQIESFQKMLWEKRKFITETGYCITAGAIDRSLYPEIAACDAQWAEWKALFQIDEDAPDLFSDGDRNDRRMAFLEAHPTLVVDTRHFTADFTDRLLGSIDDLDEMLDGLLIRGDNAQALSLVSAAYRRRARCIHVDPPYNTQTSGFLYKNSYRHSSWLTMMENRIRRGEALLDDHGSFVCHVDENEYERLHLLFDRLGIPNAGTLIWDKRNPMTGGGGIAIQHEYVIWRTRSNRAFNLPTSHVQSILDQAKESIRKYPASMQRARAHFADRIRRNESLSGGERAYRYLDDDGRVYTSVSLRAPEPRTDAKFFEPLIHPETGRPCPVPPNGFSRTPETLRAMIARGEILFGADDTTQPRQKRFLREASSRQLTSVLQDARRGKSDLHGLGLSDFPYSHPVSLYADLIGAATEGATNAFVLDYFAGSGTTGHAVMLLNREDGARRRFILVEVGDHFDAVLVPRMKKVAFAPQWKDGAPVRMPTRSEAERSPRIVKYHRIESYEDALNNIVFDEAEGHQALQFDDYVLRYLLKWETRTSETLLNVERLSRPFDYRLGVRVDGKVRKRVADLPETFNYLLGLRARTRRVHQDAGRRYLVYCGTVDEKTIAVVWRETEGWGKADLIRDKEFVAEQGLTEGADAVYVNGDSFIPNAKALEPVFKALMFAPTEG